MKTNDYIKFEDKSGDVVLTNGMITIKRHKLQHSVVNRGGNSNTVTYSVNQ